MHQIKYTLEIGFAAMVLTFALAACGGDGKKPQDPEPPPPPAGGCCQLDARCVEVDDAVACEQRGGEFFESATCTANQCVVQ